MAFSQLKSERDAVLRISQVADAYLRNPNSVDSRNRMAEGISVYMQTVAANGQSQQSGDFNAGSAFKKLFDIKPNDGPAVRYNKITTFRI